MNDVNPKQLPTLPTTRNLNIDWTTRIGIGQTNGQAGSHAPSHGTWCHDATQRVSRIKLAATTRLESGRLAPRAQPGRLDGPQRTPVLLLTHGSKTLRHCCRCGT